MFLISLENSRGGECVGFGRTGSLSEEKYFPTQGLLGVPPIPDGLRLVFYIGEKENLISPVLLLCKFFLLLPGGFRFPDAGFQIVFFL